MAQTMRIQSLQGAETARAARTMAPSKTAFGGRVARAQRAFTSQPCSKAVQRVQQQAQRNTHVVCVAAQEAPATQQTGTQQWYALVANAEFFCNDVQNEPLAEQLRERVRYFKEQDRPTDFYLIPNPTWLDAKFPTQAKQVKRPCMALVSTDKQWMTFMKLRLDRVMKLDLTGMSEADVLAAGEELPEFKKPEKWTAPYSMYAPYWWRVFYPGTNN